MSRISLLRHNLIELEYANSHRGQLTTNCSGTLLYDSDAGIGRIWKTIHHLLSPFMEKGRVSRLLDRAIKMTCHIFAEKSRKVEDHCMQLRTKITAGTLTSEQWYKHASAILRWHDATDTMVCRYGGMWKHPEGVKELYPLLHFERRSGISFPYQGLTALAGDRPLTDKNRKHLKKWVEALKKVNIGQFHYAMETFVAYLKMNKTIADVSLLEYRLLKTFPECRDLFLQKDPVYAEWKMTVEGTIPLPNTENIAALKADPTRLIRFSVNRALLGIKRQILQREEWGIPTVHWYFLDPEGRYAIQERLELMVADINWTSDQGGLTCADRNVARPIAWLIRWLNDNRRCNTALDPQFLGFDNKKRLRSTVVGEPAPYSFTVLEQFAWRCAKNNLVVFKYLLMASRLDQDPLCGFYRHLFELAMENDVPIDVGHLGAGARYEIRSGREIAQGKAFVDDVRRLKKTIPGKEQWLKKQQNDSYAISFLPAYTEREEQHELYYQTGNR